jgi:hypothetical protein
LAAATMKNALGALEMLSEGFIHNLGDRQMIEVCLASDRLNPAPFDMEGSSLNAFQVQNNARYVDKPKPQTAPWLVVSVSLLAIPDVV